MDPEVITVDLAGHSYPVDLGHGVLAHTGQSVLDQLGRRRVIVIGDAVLSGTDAERNLRKSFHTAGFDPTWTEIPGGETSKSLAFYAELMERVLAGRPDRKTAVVAFGGGVVGDLAGFVAATLLRGVPYVQIPTTLLAQVDSSVGGKTGINSRHGKNLIGSFHQPALVIADLEALNTLPQRQWLAGYAEVVKYGLLGDADFFAWLETNGAHVIAADASKLHHAVATSIRAKAEIVRADEREQQDVRALLNLGHTFGHAYEALTGYSDKLLHGEAVALGLVQAFTLSARLGYCSAADRDRVIAHFQAVGLPTQVGETIGSFSADAVREAMAGDKKAVDGRMTLVLVRGIGQAFVHRDIGDDDLLAHLKEAA